MKNLVIMMIFISPLTQIFAQSDGKGEHTVLNRHTVTFNLDLFAYPCISYMYRVADSKWSIGGSIGFNVTNLLLENGFVMSENYLLVGPSYLRGQTNYSGHIFNYYNIDLEAMRDVRKYLMIRAGIRIGEIMFSYDPEDPQEDYPYTGGTIIGVFIMPSFNYKFISLGVRIVGAKLITEDVPSKNLVRRESGIVYLTPVVISLNVKF